MEVSTGTQTKEDIPLCRTVETCRSHAGPPTYLDQYTDTDGSQVVSYLCNESDL